MDKPDLDDPKINRSYAELAAHYDTLIDPVGFQKSDEPATCDDGRSSRTA